jgi:hypothetical protein
MMPFRISTGLQWTISGNFDSRLTSETPDAQFDRALQWAEIAID